MGDAEGKKKAMSNYERNTHPWSNPPKSGMSRLYMNGRYSTRAKSELIVAIASAAQEQEGCHRP